jgi:uncharacterized protein YggE
MNSKVLTFFIFILTSLLLFENAESRQFQSQPVSPSVSIQSTGTVTIPAEFIRFTVNLNIFSKDLNDAFDQHKKQEAFLAELIKENNFNDGELIFNPISVSATRNPTSGNGFTTRQVVVFRVTDFDLFENVQKTLIENGFTNLNGTFGANETDDNRNQALKNAMENAKAKAEIIALSAEKKLGDVLSVEYGVGRVQPIAYREMSFDMQSAGQLSEFEQTITITENVSVTFELYD